MEEEIKNELDELGECCKARDEYLAGWQRAKADLINYKKEELTRMGQIIRFAAEELALKFLPILDTFERAEAETPEDLKADRYFKGLLLVGAQMKELLKSFEVEEITALNQDFNPNFHEVVAEVEGKEPGKVAEVVQGGYMMQGKVIRPAKVKIIKH
ncbi:MAG: nucleotide exchange factor GrpE [Candidatus Nealsonbacteria bacterium]|nr:nucleotide exchange factor GrpE [Candidatus Nealsonbacteria bacterium]